ncbi:MAG: PIG-L family deacetylase [Elusimicrobia bacterium]|nr:PIG-L family deacetylase [Elusimicrobiota bacterium]MBU2614343.1 PIG-L family deacetylase [Elusimicrobiota bacterium]
MNILVIGSHPDDLEYGCGGTLIKLAKAGHNIFLLVMTRGEAGGHPGLRKKEQLKVSKILKAHLFWGNFSDTKIPITKKIINKIEFIIKKVNPTLIFVHYPEDTHQDHRNTSQATATAARYIRNVLFYEVPTTINFLPSVYTDIAATIQSKIILLESHKSQVHSTRIAELSIIESSKACALFRGFQNRTKYAEGFVPLKLALDFGLNL